MEKQHFTNLPEDAMEQQNLTSLLEDVILEDVMEIERQHFTNLPEDVMRLILANLDAPRHLRALSLTSRGVRDLVMRLGWHIFVRTQFSSLALPEVKEDDHAGWMRLANSLSWQINAWDRRGFQFTALLPHQPNFGYSRHGLGKLFHPVIDVRANLHVGSELLVWGEGENIQARFRQRGRRTDLVDSDENALAGDKEIWMRQDGKSGGYRPSYDDIRALTIVDGIGKSQEETGLLVGRYNGDLKLVSAEPGNFGQTLAKFGPSRPKMGPVYSIDVLRQESDTRVAVATKSDVLIYDLAADFPRDPKPLTSWGLPSNDEPPPPRGSWNCHRQSPDLHQAIWMASGKYIALGLHASTDPLRYLSVTPSGWMCKVAAKNIDVENEFGLEYKNICPRSLQPISLSGTSRKESTLLLSSWKDGTCRLQDLRTPSAFDAVYQDRLNPREALDSIMVYGTERFVGGGLSSATLKIFDLRWSQGYCNTLGQPSSKVDARQNASVYLSSALGPGPLQHAGVWALAKASDAAPNFYVGVTGSLIETELAETVPCAGALSCAAGGGEHCPIRKGDPNYNFKAPEMNPRLLQAQAARPYVERRLFNYGMMETGDGVPDREHTSIKMPPMWRFQAHPSAEPHHPRLDRQWARF